MPLQRLLRMLPKHISHIPKPNLRPTADFQMCLFNLIKHHVLSQRNASAARRDARLEKNDHQRLNENLLRIALKRRTSVNSLTDRDPTKVAMEKQIAWEEEMGRK